MNYYNEIDPYCIAWLKNLIAARLIPRGDVDGRRIEEVRPHELNGYTHCHFFAGIGGWAYAARLAGWPDWEPLWTGSCPCQPFSLAGKKQGNNDSRHLWPHFHRLISGARPPLIMGEQIAGAPGYKWLRGILTDLAQEGYAGRGVDIPAGSINAPHVRNRIYWVAHPGGTRLEDRQRHSGTQAQSDPVEQLGCSPWREWESIGPDHRNQLRRIKPGIEPVVDGVSARIPKLCAIGNAIVPQLAAEVIRAYMEAYDVDL